MKGYRRRKKSGTKKKSSARRNPTTAKRKAAAKKAAATRKKKATARRAAALKGARTRKRNAAKKKTARKKTSVRRKPAARKTVRRRKARKNPMSAAAKRGINYYHQLRAQAASLGIKGTSKMNTAQLEARLARHGKRPKKRRKAKKKMSKNMRYARRYRNSKVTKVIKSGKKKGQKRKVPSGASKVSRSYLKTKRLQKRIAGGKVKSGASKMAKAMGLTRVNPASSILKDFTQTAKTLVIPSIATVGGMYAMAWGGFKLSSKIAEWDKDKKLPKALAENIVPISTAGLSLGSAMALRRLVKKKLPLIKMDGAQLAPWVAVGGLGATLLMVMATTKWGKQMTAKMGFTIGIDQNAIAQAAAEGSAPAAATVDGYISVSQYLGSYGVDIDPMGASWYGRSDISPVGDYVDAGPQNMFGGYVASDFPVHSPGPGDNTNVMATLGDYDEYGQGGMFASGYDDDVELQQTPGGTMIGEAGIFGGKGVL